MVRPVRFERMTFRVGVWHSIQLSYGRILLARYLLYHIPADFASLFFNLCAAFLIPGKIHTERSANYE